MGKQGPCCHCGVTSTPLWRNGPPEKPVLCNACGSRWRTKGTLVNYTPIHARFETDNFEPYKIPRVKTISIKNKEVKLLKRRQHNDSLQVEAVPNDGYGFQKYLDEDTSNRSSSGSAISNTESCAQFGSVDASDLSGPSQSIVWDTTVPSRKRTCVNRPKPSSVEKLTKDLCTILHEQQSSCFSGSFEEDLLLESDRPMISVEIGHGSILMRHPSSITREEESEASSLSVDNKVHLVNEAYSSGQGVQLEELKRDKFQVLGNHNSVLQHVDLKGVVNFEGFVKHLTKEEQQQLVMYLPSVDTAKVSSSLISMFDSSQFQENLSSFQQLLAEGVFDIPLTGGETSGRNTLKRLALVNLTKSKWVEQYNRLKNCKRNSGRLVLGGGKVASLNFKRPNDFCSKNISESKATVRSPRRLVSEVSYESKEATGNDCTSFSPRSIFAMPPDHGSLALDSLHSAGESSDHDLLLDMPSNATFAQAELLHPMVSSSSGTALWRDNSSSA